MAITDLINTRWQVNAGWTATAGYGTFIIYGNLLGSDEGYKVSSVWVGINSERSSVENIITFNESYLKSNTESFEIKITGGIDTTNTKLISWLEQNATQVEEPVLQLAPFLTNIANAIRTKKGTTDTINAQNFASEIESIESGSGGLTGYSTSSIGSGITFLCGLTEDGTYTETFSTSDKYVAVIVAQIVGGIGYTYNKMFLHRAPMLYYYQGNYWYCYFAIPSDNDWSVIFSGGGGGGSA